jgi:hypothetical protein
MVLDKAAAMAGGVVVRREGWKQTAAISVGCNRAVARAAEVLQ